MEISPAGWLSVLGGAGQAAAGGSVTALHLLQQVLQQQGVSTDRSTVLAPVLDAISRALSAEQVDQQLPGLQLLAAVIPETPAACFRLNYMQWGADIPQVHRVEQVVEEAGVRKEASGLLQRLMQIAVPLLPQAAKQPGQGTVGMVEAITAGARALPPAARSSCMALDAFCRSVIPAASTPQALRSALAQLYPLLPRAHSDALSWETSMQQLLATLHDGLDALFMGLDGSDGSQQARASLKQGVEGFWSGGKALGQAATQGQADGVRACLDTLEHMLTCSQPIPVPLPATSIFLLLTRILAFDDSPAHQGRVPPSASGYRQLLGALPGLHVAALQLLQQLLKAGGGTLRPLHASLSRLVSDLLRRVAAAGPATFSLTSWLVRVEVYKLAGAVVQAAGWAAGRQMNPTAIQAARLELYGHPSGSVPATAETDPLAKIAPHKKRKRGRGKGQGTQGGSNGAADGLGPGTDGAEGAGAAALEPWRRETAVQVAVLQLLETLLQVCGAVIPQDQRLQLDAMAAHMASTAFAAAEGLAAAVETGARESLAAPLQLAACKALVASILAPAPHSPAFLPLALRLLRQGLSCPDALLSSLCSSALLSLEVLLQPHATPPAPTRPLLAQPPQGAHPSSLPTSYMGPPKDGEVLGMPRMITEGRAGGASMQSTIQRPPVTQPVQQTLPGLEVHAPAPVWGVDSSDSEGPMPEIDSGSDMDASAETSDDDL
ncbi:hypothetical protein WJX84_000711 [Apatococcus fuscideae]|uniref:Pre-rRNA-processing protein RIX1 N-terminal domain-containing protein n=1 Tax=Apatococcus fuscideae TaxID=2026836 RepID=A0AAW1T2C9_9CHLO